MNSRGNRGVVCCTSPLLHTACPTHRQAPDAPQGGHVPYILPIIAVLYRQSATLGHPTLRLAASSSKLSSSRLWLWGSALCSDQCWLCAPA
jgi:hypothetical protein